MAVEDKIEPIPSVPKLIILYELSVGLIETIGGITLFLFRKNIFVLYESLKGTELFEDPNDLIVKLMEKIIPNLIEHRIYIVILLLAFGIIKVASGIGLIYKKVWAEHLLIVFLVALMPFELVGIINHFSFSELIYLVVDVSIFLYLVKFKPKIYFQRLFKDLKSAKLK